MMKRSTLAAFLVLTLCLSGGCGQPNDKLFQGYVEGEYVYLASSRGGRLERLLTARGETVDAGALLFELEAEYERQTLRQAEEEMRAATAQLADMETGKRPAEVAMAVAQLDQARAEAAKSATDLRRLEALIRGGGISRQELDNARAAAKVAADRVEELSRQVEIYKLPEREKKIEAQRATVQSAAARVAQVRWELEQKKLQAPAAGLVYDTLYRQGEWVAAGSPVVQLLPPGNVKIRFFVPETMLDAIRPGSPVLVAVDGRDAPISATVSSVAASAEYTPPVIYSNETRSKLVFMVEAQPEAAVASTLHPGQPVSVSLP